MTDRRDPARSETGGQDPDKPQTGAPDTGGSAAGRPRRAARPCPICSKMSVEKYHPFCSARCGDIDLHRWLGGRYAIPTEEPPETLDGPLPPDDDTD